MRGIIFHFLDTSTGRPDVRVMFQDSRLLPLSFFHREAGLPNRAERG